MEQSIEFKDRQTTDRPPDIALKEMRNQRPYVFVSSTRNPHSNLQRERASQSVFLDVVEIVGEGLGFFGQRGGSFAQFPTMISFLRRAKFVSQFL